MFFDKNEDVDIYLGGNLPHMHQDGKIQYVTFRLADSLPLSKTQELNAMIARFKEKHPEPWDYHVKLEYWKTISPHTEKLLHNGFGSLVLKSPQVRQILIDSIAYFDEKRYLVDAYVIMPNHVHMLILPFDTYKIKDILKCIKGYSAYAINKLIGSSGEVWMRESFDRLVRNEDAYKYNLNYIIANPRNIRAGEYTLYIRD